jgi:bacillopeptidase F (M6 metalloprotease family)
VYSFPAGDPQGWTFTSNCSAGAVDWQVDSFRSTSPTDSLYMGDPFLRTYECGFFSHVDDATSAPITLAASGSSVSFQVWIAVEGGSFYDQLRLQVIPAAGMPVTVWTHSDDPSLSDGSSGGVFVAETVDLSAFDGQTVQLQFHFDTIDSAVNDSEGVYVDDIIVSAVGACF